MGSYLPRVALTVRVPGWGFHTVRGGMCWAISTQGITAFGPCLLELYRRIFYLGLGPCSFPWVALALRIPGYGVHTVRAGIDPGNRRFRPGFAGVVDVWKDFDPCPRGVPLARRTPLLLRETSLN